MPLGDSYLAGICGCVNAQVIVYAGHPRLLDSNIARSVNAVIVTGPVELKIIGDQIGCIQMAGVIRICRSSS